MNTPPFRCILLTKWQQIEKGYQALSRFSVRTASDGKLGPRRNEVGVAPEVTWNVGGSCDYLNTWVGLSFHKLLAIAVQSKANAQKPELGGAGDVNAQHGWGWT